jgi:hypothetical protein
MPARKARTNPTVPATTEKRDSTDFIDRILVNGGSMRAVVANQRGNGRRLVSNRTSRY